AFSLALEQELRAYDVTVVTVCSGRLRPNGNPGSAQPAKGRWAGVSQTHVEVVHNALRALENGGGLTVPGALNKVSGFAQCFIPRRLVSRLGAKMSRARWTAA